MIWVADDELQNEIKRMMKMNENYDKELAEERKTLAEIYLKSKCKVANTKEPTDWV